MSCIRIQGHKRNDHRWSRTHVGKPVELHKSKSLLGRIINSILRRAA